MKTSDFVQSSFKIGIRQFFMNFDKGSYLRLNVKSDVKSDILRKTKTEKML